MNERETKWQLKTRQSAHMFVTVATSPPSQMTVIKHGSRLTSPATALTLWLRTHMIVVLAGRTHMATYTAYVHVHVKRAICWLGLAEFDPLISGPDSLWPHLTVTKCHITLCLTM